MKTLFGVAIDGYSAANVRAFEQAVGASVQTVLGYGAGSGTWADMNPGWLFSQQFLGATGKPVNISMPIAPDNAGVAEYQSIARGEHRADHEAWARTILAAAPNDGSPIYVRTTWEMPGEWFPWSQVAKDNPDAFKGAWQQFADAFHDVSGRFQMVWDFNSDRGPVEHLYPGDEAVDVIGQDIYWNSDFQGGEPDAAWAKTASGYSRGLDWMADFAAAHNKPMAISEWGVPINDPNITAEEGAAWIGHFKDWILEQNSDGDPGVAYVNWWNVSEAFNHGGRVENDTDSAVRAALKDMAQALAAGAPVVNPPVVNPPIVNPPPGGTALSAGTGPDSLVLKISQDAYQGSAQYKVTVDGKQVGGTFTASASHAAGQSDTLTLKGDWAAGAHSVSVSFLNDLYGGSAATDRNLYVDSATYNGAAVSGAKLVLLGAEPANFGFTEAGAPIVSPPIVNPPPGGGTALSAGTGPDSLVLKISQDAYQGSAQYKVTVDGKQVGGTFTASASHAAGQSDTLTLKGDWAAGAHSVSVSFLNDLYGGSAATDRNLYVDSATYNGAAVSGAKLVLLGAEPANFGFTEAGAPVVDLALQGTANADALTGGAGADRLRGLAGNDTLSGGDGNDALNGGSGNDVINGGAGNDYLLGSLGADTLTGGAGPDRFAFQTELDGGDTILDFKAAEGDRLDLRGMFETAGQNYASLSAGGFLKATAVSGGVLVSVDADGGGDNYAALVTLKGLTLAGIGNDLLIA